jgi:hypothetical protein
MNKRRILALAKYLDELPAELSHTFDMRSFFSVTNTTKKVGDCGTTACALGWATRVPCLRRAGLRMNRAGWPVLVSGETAYNVCAKLFDIDDAQTLELFSVVGHLDETPKQWAERARKFVANGGAVQYAR